MILDFFAESEKVLLTNSEYSTLKEKIEVLEKELDEIRQISFQKTTDLRDYSKKIEQIKKISSKEVCEHFLNYFNNNLLGKWFRDCRTSSKYVYIKEINTDISIYSEHIIRITYESIIFKENTKNYNKNVETFIFPYKNQYDYFLQGLEELTTPIDISIIDFYIISQNK